MNLVRIAARVAAKTAGPQIDILHDIGHVEGSIQREVEKAFSKLVKESDVWSAYTAITDVLRGAYEKVYPDRKSSLTQHPRGPESVQSEKDALDQIDLMFHEDFHEAVNPDFGVFDGQNPLMDALHEAYIKSVQYREDRGKYFGPVYNWNENFVPYGEDPRPTLQKYADEAPEPYRKIFNRALKRFDAKAAKHDGLSSKARYDALFSDWSEAWYETVDSSTDVLDAEVEGQLRKYVGLLSKRLREVKSPPSPARR